MGIVDVLHQPFARETARGELALGRSSQLRAGLGHCRAPDLAFQCRLERLPSGKSVRALMMPCRKSAASFAPERMAGTADEESSLHAAETDRHRCDEKGLALAGECRHIAVLMRRGLDKAHPPWFG